MADLTVGVTLTTVSQITGLNAEIGVQLTVAPTSGEIVIAQGKSGFVQVGFSLNGTTATTISQEFLGATGGTTISSANPLALNGLYYPGEVITEDNKGTVIGSPSAKIYLQP